MYSKTLKGSIPNFFLCLEHPKKVSIEGNDSMLNPEKITYGTLYYINHFVWAMNKKN